MEVDYIIVGFGLAGLAFVTELGKKNKSFIVFEDSSQRSSLVAGGVYNPVILKRFTPVWNAQSQLEIALPFYKKLEQRFKKKYDYKIDILRIFKSLEEQNNWTVASDKPVNSNYMNPAIIKEKFNGIMADFGFGKLTKTGRIDTKLLLNDYKNYLKDQNLIRYTKFNYSEIEFLKEGVKYNDIKAKKIVFCEGFGLKQNPYFKYLPMQEAKGELLTIYAPKLNIDFLIKAAVFVLPLGNDHYKVGATFNWKDKTLKPTQEGRSELVNKLNTFLTTPYTIIDQTAGIRPTVKDRRPLVGVHPKYKQLAILNGLGTRGVMLAPILAKHLIGFLEKGLSLDLSTSISRFD